MPSHEYNIDFVDPLAKSPVALPRVYVDGPNGDLGSPAPRSLDINLIGEGNISWGEYMLENMVHLLENFASPELGITGTPDPATSIFAPVSPTSGQLWFNTTRDKLYVYNGSAWNTIGDIEVSDGSPPSATTGQFWYDTTVQSVGSAELGRELKIYNNGWTRVVDDYLPRDGSKVMFGSLNMNSQDIIELKTIKSPTGQVLTVTNSIKSDNDITATGTMTAATVNASQLFAKTSTVADPYVWLYSNNIRRGVFYFNNTNQSVLLYQYATNGVTVDTSLALKGGNVSINGPTPTASDHLTRRDFVQAEDVSTLTSANSYTLSAANELATAAAAFLVSQTIQSITTGTAWKRETIGYIRNLSTRWAVDYSLGVIIYKINNFTSGWSARVYIGGILVSEQLSLGAATSGWSMSVVENMTPSDYNSVELEIKFDSGTGTVEFRDINNIVLNFLV